MQRIIPRVAGIFREQVSGCSRCFRPGRTPSAICHTHVGRSGHLGATHYLFFRSLRVIGTAGSGKTQLALRLLRDADAAGHKAAYICFNRALADHISRSLAPVRIPAETFHEYAQRVVRRSGEVVDFKQVGAFDHLATRCIELLEQAEPDLDLIILDEMQDMQPEWVLAMLSRLKSQGKAVLLEDPEQQLYKDRDCV
jgi:nucleoside-triphosphatase THEP1